MSLNEYVETCVFIRMQKLLNRFHPESWLCDLTWKQNYSVLLRRASEEYQNFCIYFDTPGSNILTHLVFFFKTEEKHFRKACVYHYPNLPDARLMPDGCLSAGQLNNRPVRRLLKIESPTLPIPSWIVVPQ